MNDQRVTAILPMRHGSERVPGKNWRTLGDRPLFGHMLSALLSCERVGEVIVDTDSDLLIEAVSTHYPAARALRRPAHLGAGDASMNAVLRRVLSVVDGEWFLQVHATTPFLSPATIDAAIGSLLDARPRGNGSYDSAFGVTRRQVRLWSVDLAPLNHDPENLLPTQELEPFYEENSALYVFSRTSFLERDNRIGRRPIAVEVPLLEALDIDNEEDFQLATALWTGRQGSRA